MKIWKLHPKAAKVVPAEITLNGSANPGGVRYCRPYAQANQLGWWIFPPIDIDILWKGGKSYEYVPLESYSSTDYILAKSLIKDSDNVNIDKWCVEQTGRTKFTWGAVEENVVQIWTGLIFQTKKTPLLIRSPINFSPRSYYIMEGIIETDWLWYDIWLNIVFTEPNQLIQLRKDTFPPLAQIIPLGENEDLEEEFINRDTKEANDVFSFWIQYNQEKFGNGGKQKLTENRTKDATTYHKIKTKVKKGLMNTQFYLSKFLKPRFVKGKK